jgi:hypothetical protein
MEMLAANAEVTKRRLVDCTKYDPQTFIVDYSETWKCLR